MAAARVKELTTRLIGSLHPTHQSLIKTLPGVSDTATELLWAYFLSLSECPRRSHHMDEVTAWCAERSKEIGCEMHTDDIGNVVLRLEPSEGYKRPEGANSDYVILQGHLDMVTSANEGSTHDFSKDPVLVKWHDSGDGWLQSSKGTTLGADDGIGVASALTVAAMSSIARSAGGDAGAEVWSLLPERSGAVATKDGFRAGLECLFTVNEETDMSGAEQIDRNGFLKGDRLINIDTEEEGGICMGCAGGFEQTIDLPLDEVPASDLAALEPLRIEVRGLFGGHSGVDIARPRASAIDLACRVSLAVTAAVPEAALASISAGTAVNTIPRECTVELAVPAGSVEPAREAAQAAWAAAVAEYSPVSDERLDDPVDGIRMALLGSADGAKLPARAATAPSSLRALSLVHTLPHGVLRQVPSDLSAVETSCNFALVSVAADAGSPLKLSTHLFARSSRESQMALVQSRLEAIARLAGATISAPFAAFPGWTPNPHSPLLKITIDGYRTAFAGAEPKVYDIHAGLECGLLGAAYPLDCVSVGPSIRDAHTIDECLHAETVPRFVSFLFATIANL